MVKKKGRSSAMVGEEDAGDISTPSGSNGSSGSGSGSSISSSSGRSHEEVGARKAGKSQQRTSSPVSRPPPQFLKSLVRAVSERRDIITYKDGTLTVQDMDILASEVLPRLFRTSTTKQSFVRQLNYFGFSKAPTKLPKQLPQVLGGQPVVYCNATLMGEGVDVLLTLKRRQPGKPTKGAGPLPKKSSAHQAAGPPIAPEEATSVQALLSLRSRQPARCAPNAKKSLRKKPLVVPQPTTLSTIHKQTISGTAASLGSQSRDSVRVNKITPGTKEHRVPQTSTSSIAHEENITNPPASQIPLPLAPHATAISGVGSVAAPWALGFDGHGLLVGRYWNGGVGCGRDNTRNGTNGHRTPVPFATHNVGIVEESLTCGDDATEGGIDCWGNIECPGLASTVKRKLGQHFDSFRGEDVGELLDSIGIIAEEYLPSQAYAPRSSCGQASTVALVSVSIQSMVSSQAAHHFATSNGNEAPHGGDLGDKEMSNTGVDGSCGQGIGGCGSGFVGDSLGVEACHQQLSQATKIKRQRFGNPVERTKQAATSCVSNLHSGFAFRCEHNHEEGGHNMATPGTKTFVDTPVARWGQARSAAATYVQAITNSTSAYTHPLSVFTSGAAHARSTNKIWSGEGDAPQEAGSALVARSNAAEGVSCRAWNGKGESDGGGREGLSAGGRTESVFGSFSLVEGDVSPARLDECFLRERLQTSACSGNLQVDQTDAAEVAGGTTEVGMLDDFPFL